MIEVQVFRFESLYTYTIFRVPSHIHNIPSPFTHTQYFKSLYTYTIFQVPLHIHNIPRSFTHTQYFESLYTYTIFQGPCTHTQYSKVPLHIHNIPRSFTHTQYSKVPVRAPLCNGGGRPSLDKL